MLIVILSINCSADITGFIRWFLSNKLPVIRDTMLKPVREECGLGCPPQPFTTNASESINAILKRKVDYKQSHSCKSRKHTSNMP